MMIKAHHHEKLCLFQMNKTENVVRNNECGLFIICSMNYKMHQQPYTPNNKQQRSKDKKDCYSKGKMEGNKVVSMNYTKKFYLKAYLRILVFNIF